MLLTSLLLACSDDGSGDTSDDRPALQGPPVVINEFCARNDAANADEMGEFDDWIEIYNTSDTIVQFDGLYLSDDFETPTKWALPTGQGIDGFGFALVWADGTPEQGDHHTSFKLSGTGEPLAIYYVEDGYDPVRVDAIEFQAQAPDTSSARVPDGTLTWVPGSTPTPNASNG